MPRPSSTPFYTWAPLETGDSKAAGGGGERSGEAERRWADGRTRGARGSNATEAEMMLGLARTAHSGRCRSNYGHRFGGMRGQRLKVGGREGVQTIDAVIPEDISCPYLYLSRLTMTPIFTPVCESLLFNFRASCRPSPLASPPPRHRRCRRRVAFHRFCYNFRMGRGRGRRSTLSRARRSVHPFSAAGERWSRKKSLAKNVV